MPLNVSVGQPITVWRPRSFDGLVFYRGTNVRHPYPKHWHEEWHLCVYTAGAGYLGYQGNSSLRKHGDFVLTPPGEVHENWVRDGPGVSYCSLYLETAALTRALRDLAEEARVPQVPLFSSEDVLLKQKFFFLYRSMESGAERLQCEAALVDLLGALFRRRTSLLQTPPKRPSNRTIRAIQNHIEEHFDRSISLAELACAAGMSPYHLHHVFCRQTGIPPHAYQTQVRVNRAKALLRAGWACCETAIQTGFADQSQFHRHFHRLVGVSPRRYAADFSSAPARTSKTQSPAIQQHP